MIILRIALLAALVASIAVPLSAQNRPLPYRIAETGREYRSLADAVSRIGNGNGTIEVQPGTWRDCVVQEAGNITYRAITPGSAIFDGGVCEGKATLVLRGRSARVEGLIFQNIAVPDENGAGIRLERGDLNVVNSLFRDSQQGILSAIDRNSRIVIDKSTFSGLGLCASDCAHSLYIGDYGSLTVTRSRFERGQGGHYVKSRAAQVSITDSSFDDSNGNGSNYMIDLPGGASGEITRNIFVQGQAKENWSAFIAIAAEGRSYSSAGLQIFDNSASLAPGVVRDTWFVANWSRDAIALGDNRLGKGLSPYDQR
ncbi:right-handed parallel beta-helix repeat-containing protein [Blastomonas sp.]|uniref:right-handed parallel beta-helix repeat-containing protein n=1 Tax=Blastomonas sp. TaxID=1909299 RepID=UPI00261200FA|nr:right-handed parallel beta-helix repeat-containing protein [Blastomonas sp.]MDM7956060.1 right-handed parallel beta-helix repeat-containing protein [Blastomonas sp.]